MGTTLVEELLAAADSCALLAWGAEEKAYRKQAGALRARARRICELQATRPPGLLEAWTEFLRLACGPLPATPPETPGTTEK